MNDDQLRAALLAEYLHLQKAVEDMDARAVTIKAWSISFSLAAVAGARSAPRGTRAGTAAAASGSGRS